MEQNKIIACEKFANFEIAPMHTCEHIVNRTMINLFNCGRAIEAHIEKKKSKLDYAIPNRLTENEIYKIEEKVNEIINLNLPISMEYIKEEEARGRFDLKRVPKNDSGIIRIIKVGDYDECPCIGVHVEETSQIGTFKIISHSYDNGVLRIRFKLL